METTLMLLAATATIYLTSLVLGERKDHWFRRRQGQRLTAEAGWRDRFMFGPPRRREGWLVVLALFAIIALEAWLILLILG